MAHPSTLSETGGVRVPKACLPCAKVKARCDMEPGKSSCIRCRRLQKICSSQAPGAHRRMKGNVCKSEELEGSPRLASASATPERSPSRSEPDVTSVSAIAFIDHVVGSVDEGEAIIQRYRRDMEPEFPFVVLGPNSEWNEFKAKRPLLLLAVLMVGLRRDQKRQEMVAKKIREVISRDLLIGGQQTLDMLQCLLVYVNWYHFHLHLGSQLCNFVHLIMAVVTELGLNKEPSVNPPVSGLGRFGYFGKSGSVLVMGTPEGCARRTLEERRAFLGCFFITSVTSLCVRDIEPLRYSRYVENCCDSLAGASEYPTDASAVHLIRLHGLAYNITHAPSLSRDHNAVDFNTSSIGVDIRAAESDLVRLRSSFANGFRHSALLSIHYHVIEIFLYESAIDAEDTSILNSSSASIRSQMLEKCAEATRQCFDALQSTSHSLFFDIPYTSLNLMSHAIVILSKLTLLRTKSWHLSDMQNLPDFPSTMERVIENIHLARAAEHDMSAPSDTISFDGNVPKLFTMLPETLRKIASVHEAMHAAQLKSLDQGLPSPFTDFDLTYTWDDFLAIPAGPFPDMFDAEFWQPVA